MNIDSFVRRLIGSPGWHQHLKRASGAQLVSVIEWSAVNSAPEKAGSGASGQVTMVPYPKEMYDWYVSTSLNTAKLKIPFQFKVLIACLLIVPIAGYYAYQIIKSKEPVKANMQHGFAMPALSRAPGQSEPKHVMTTAEYVDSFQPRLPGMAFSAPRYDDMTKPVNVPYPAACINSKSRCECYSQQATKLDVPWVMCMQLVKGGFFNDWQAAVQQANAGKAVQESPVVVASARIEPMTLPPSPKRVDVPEPPSNRVIQARAPFPVFTASAAPGSK